MGGGLSCDGIWMKDGMGWDGLRIGYWKYPFPQHLHRGCLSTYLMISLGYTSEFNTFSGGHFGSSNCEKSLFCCFCCMISSSLSR